MRRDEDIERRLLEWARWREGAGQGGGGGGAWGEIRSTTGYREAIIPTAAVDASITNDGVMALDGPLRAAVEAWYLRGDGTQHMSSGALAAARLRMSEATMHKRVALAHQALKVWLAERAALRREAERRDAELRALARGVGVR